MVTVSTISNRAMAAQVGISHTALLRHVNRGIVRDDENGRFYPESADRIRRELALNRARKYRHCQIYE